MNTKSLKLAVLGIFLSFAIFGFFISGSYTAAQKKQSDILEKAAAYKTWRQPVKPIQQRPLERLVPAITATRSTFSIADSSGFGWSIIIDPISSAGIKFEANESGLPQSSTSQGTTRIVMPSGPLRFPDKDPKNPHEKGEKTFARVFANDLALGEIYKEKPVFPAGSMIVREKLLKESDETPDLVTVMLKHEKGFSPKSNDWEFFVLDARVAKIEKNEKVGSCSKCHTQANGTDFVFKTYLK